MYNLFPKNIVQTSSQLAEDQKKTFDDAKERLAKEQKDHNSSHLTTLVGTEPVVAKESSKVDEGQASRVNDSNMPLVEALRLHFFKVAEAVEGEPALHR